MAMHCLLTGMSTATPDKSKAPGAKRQMVEKEVARAEDAEDESVDPVGDKTHHAEGMLCLKLQKAGDGLRPRVALERSQILLSYASAAVNLECEPMPSGGIAAQSPFGPYYVYGDAKDLKLIADTHKELTVVGPAPAKDIFALDASYIQIEDDPSMGLAGASRSVLNAVTVHVVAFLQQGAEFRVVKPHHFKAFWASAGFAAMRVRRECVKMGEGADAKQVDGMYTEVVHMHVMPNAGRIKDAEWPPVIRVEEFANRFNTTKSQFFVKYKIMEHHELPPDAEFCRAVCHRPKPCACDSTKRSAVCSPGDLPEGTAVKRQKGKLSRTEAMGMLGKMLAKDKEATECPHFLNGRCCFVRQGVTCGFKHPEGVDPSAIKCALSPRVGVICKNGKKCLYNHDADM